MFKFIQQQTDLAPILAVMDQHTNYGLDTEFIKVDTLWPKLGVFQINIAGQIYLLDGATLDLSEFWQRIFQAKQNIFHACSEDIDLIYHYAKHTPLNNVFDTQIGMAFLGHGLQVSYQNALKTILNVEIEKDQTRSDWLARPLSNEQLNYAANDVLYLMQLSAHLQENLAKKGMLDWVLEDCQHLTQEIATQTPLEQLYLDVGHYRHSRRQLMQLQQLAVWREKMVHELNVPRSFIFKNTIMLELVETPIHTIFQLSQIKGLKTNVIREYGKHIVQLLKKLPEPELWPQRLARPIRHPAGEFGLKIEQLIEQSVVNTMIPKEVLLRKKWMKAIYQHIALKTPEHDLPSYLLGWRYDQLTQPLCRLLSTEQARLAAQIRGTDQ